ncbi:hypothetical protein GCM10010193_06740 [Kitasatospora atroaurantiaca]
MPATIPRPRLDGFHPSAARWWGLIPALLAVLAVMLSHGLDGENAAGHFSAAAHAVPSSPHHAAGHSHPAQRGRQHAQPESTTVSLPPDRHDDAGHDHSTHACLTGHPPQGPSIPGPWPAPAAPYPSPPAALMGADMGCPASSGNARLTGIQVLQV